MVRRYRMAFLGVTLFLLFVTTVQAQYSLTNIQAFPDSLSGRWQRVQFGDVNGDGHEDLLAIIQDRDTIGQQIGIYLHEGTRFSDSAICRINLGYAGRECVFGVGDFNNDGKADLALMSTYEASQAPKIVYGRATWPSDVTTPDVACLWPPDSVFVPRTSPYGMSAVVGDFNNDGYSDVVFPETGTSGGEQGGRFVMYYGGAAMDPQADLIIQLWASKDAYEVVEDTGKIWLRWPGPWLSKGDFNGDGVDDFFAGAFYSTMQSYTTSHVGGTSVKLNNTGAGLVYLGGADIDTIPDALIVAPLEFLQFTTASTYMYLGFWVYNAGDLDGDGADEISLPSRDWAIDFVYKGQKGLTQAPSKYQTLGMRTPYFYYTKDRYTQLAADQGGPNLVGIGDVDGDGVDDLGNARNFYGAGPLPPGIRLFFGKTNNVGAVNFDFESSDYYSIHSSNRDFDGDGRKDLVMGDANGRLCLVKLGTPDAVGEEPDTPLRYSLAQNFPNPFNPTTRIEYGLPQESYVKLVLVDILGRVVQTLVDEQQQPGAKSVVVDASRLSSGVYFYRLTADGFISIRKLIVQK